MPDLGINPTLRMREKNSLTAIVRMKKDKTKYRYTTFNKGEVQQQMLTAVELFQKAVQKQWDKISDTAYQAKIITVDLNLSEKKSDPDNWITVKL